VVRDGFGATAPELNYGVVPFPAPAGRAQQAGSTVVHGPVVVMPAALEDKAAAADLLAWMMSPETVTEMARRYNTLPSSQTAAQDPSFQTSPDLALFLDLLLQVDRERPTAGPALVSPEAHPSDG
jgi:ABC-type glycerol-3-phosphate transport system substrate-binding protein